MTFDDNATSYLAGLNLNTSVIIGVREWSESYHIFLPFANEGGIRLKCVNLLDLSPRINFQTDVRIYYAEHITA